ncbi:hypothetical protein C8D92_10456 [Tamilnaduibacter salinus]|uniref:Uncharacterized protein n=1 Tax=Tamilnaduibacter salinus TaxID=1484056 RepID=A0A2U1CX88_9GAMM|nr:hypothetical protein [Tamilnaduibacter salinus]PVY76825.1 hypothetical protein C8D92_10456 [Tamilnaduibacter salinus]
MSIDINRIIGLTQEKRIETETGVENLHIGFQNQFAEQRQIDPSGHQHRAPVVSWQENGETRRFVPMLTFQVNVTETPWLKKVLGIEEEPDYRVDADALEADIKHRLQEARKADVASV